MSGTQFISFLIGAGFSAPMGYPIGSQLNQYLVNCTGEEFAFHTDGNLVISTDHKKPDFGYKTSYDLQFEFCRELIAFYNKAKNGFDYEEFYDFLKDSATKDKDVEQIAKPYLKGYSSVKDLLHYLDNIYSQLVGYYLKDKDGNRWYDNEGHICRPIYPGYTGILNVFQHLLTTHQLKVHTTESRFIF